ncbi:TPA: hypothetical protein RUZ06_003584 [Vibrio cholerae]|uniref:Uncharacterized protein n=1 Tax=Vibrio genomosp. F10 str. ZF-129 TaxID=1187848 RepID=A0A1E5BJA7_9VIBR|nr:hypothetical protein A1QO_16995 [Vibrio genomosp. F10 str. ZF-129]HDZ9267402.1 hypothetical protein [Vibrio cholerae]
MDENQLNFMIALLSAISALLATLLMMFYRFLDQRRKLEVSPIYQAGLIQTANDVKFDQMYLSIRVLNVGSQHLYIHSPCIKIPRKIDEIDLHQIVTPDEKYPKRVESGEEYLKKTSLEQILSLLESKLRLNSNEKIRFQVTDSFGKIHKSKPIKLSTLRAEFTKIDANTLN